MNQKIIVYYWRCICSSVDRAVASGAACVGSIPIRRILNCIFLIVADAAESGQSLIPRLFLFCLPVKTSQLFNNM